MAVDKMETESDMSHSLYKQLSGHVGTEDEVKEIVQYLDQISCCPRCIMRFLGEKTHAPYQKLERLTACVSKLLVQSEDAASGDSVCVACLGILQQYFCQDQFVEQLYAKSIEAGHEYKHFYCSVTIPVTLLLREHSILVDLSDKFKSVYHGKTKEAVVAVKDVWKWINGPVLSKKLGVPFDQKSPYEIALTFVHKDIEKECNFLFDLYPDIFRRRKYNRHGWEVFTRTNVAKAIEKMTDAKFKQCYQCPPKKLADPCKCDPITCNQEAVYLAGRYNKYCRTMSQTPWIIDGERKMESSIEENICGPLMVHMKADSHRFSSSGREDVDVKMLGSGRPFLIECVNPRKVYWKQEELTKFQEEVNGLCKDIRVRDLQIVTREQTSKLKEGEENKVKHYCALCWSQTELAQEQLDSLLQTKELVLNQKTPIRVLHRRPLAVRERTVHKICATKIDKYHFKLHLSSQAGTYIKEFVHGDFGRTSPNLGTLLGVTCDILELDVEGVDLDWPPTIKESSD